MQPKLPKPVRRCLFCNMPKEDGVADQECYNCQAQGNKIWRKQMMFSKRQPHAIDNRQVSKQ